VTIVNQCFRLNNAIPTEQNGKNDNLLFFRVYGEYTAHTARLEMSLQDKIVVYDSYVNLISL
ncbi:MAG: hypothetical protein LBG58_03330, partial [Planctomycetaceae bacterium]|nr:hypothetical protein [Planctomycetaceae bacterium]